MGEVSSEPDLARPDKDRRVDVLIVPKPASTRATAE